MNAVNHTNVNNSIQSTGGTDIVSIDRPNIIFILADDYGFGDIGYNAKDIETPTLNYLSSNGLRLINYYTLCICSASRGVILTGRYDIHNGLRGIIDPLSFDGLNLDETLISDVLYRYANYETYSIGKWHIGNSFWQHTPTWRGFKYFYGMLGGSTDYFTHFNSDYTMDWSEHIGINCNFSTKCARIAEETYGIYSTHLITNKAIQIITNHDANHPFFIYLSFQAIHSPPQAPQRYIDKYNETIKHKQRRIAAGMIDCMDQGIGNITKALTEYNLINNTMIIFSSDNGAPISSGDSVGGENWPLRGGKHSVFEGGTKVPAFIYYPSKQVETDNNIYTHLFHSADWMATIIESVGLNIDEIIGVNGKYLKLDGKSHWNNLYSSMNKQRAIREWLYYGNDNPVTRYPPGQAFALRLEQYKMIWNNGGKPDKWYKYVYPRIAVAEYDLRNMSYLGLKFRNEAHVYKMDTDPFEMNKISVDALRHYDNVTHQRIVEKKKELDDSFIEIKLRIPPFCEFFKNVELETMDAYGLFPSCYNHWYPPFTFDQINHKSH